jgi:hypothetical protein
MAMQHQDRNLQGERESLGFASHRLTSALDARTDLRANAEVLALCWKSESELVVATRAAVYERAAGSDAVNQGREMFRPLNGTAISSSSAQAVYFDEFPDRIYCSLAPRGLHIVARGVPSIYFDVTEDGRAAVAREDRIWLYDPTAGWSEQSYRLSAKPSALAWDCKGEGLAIGLENGTLVIARTGEGARTLSSLEAVKIDRILWGRANTYLVLVQGSLMTNIFCGDKPGIGSKPRQWYLPAPISALSIRPWGSEVAVGLNSGELRIGGISRFTQARTYQFDSGVTALAWSPSAKRMAIATSGCNPHIIRVCR